MPLTKNELRRTMGAQYTEKEAEAMIKRSYEPKKKKPESLRETISKNYDKKSSY